MDDDDASLFDSLTGRDELKQQIATLEERIEELEEQNTALQEQLDAAKERRANAVQDKQTIAEERNRLEDKLTSLNDRLSNQSESSTAATIDQMVGPKEIPELLDRLNSVTTHREGACVARIKTVDSLPDEVASMLQDGAVDAIRRRTPCIVLADDMGVCRVMLEPPTPFETEVSWSSSFALDDATFRPTGTFTFGLLRSDTFIVGEYEGAERQNYESLSTDVKSDHSKGGFSQGRFERRRDEQIDNHLDAVEQLLASMPEPRIIVGEERLVAELSDVSRTATADATGATEDALNSAFYEYWSTRLTLL